MTGSITALRAYRYFTIWKNETTLEESPAGLDDQGFQKPRNHPVDSPMIGFPTIKPYFCSSPFCRLQQALVPFSRDNTLPRDIQWTDWQTTVKR